MDEKELLKERFKSAVTSVVKVISENFDLEVKFGSNVSSKENSLTLPEIVNLKNMQDFTNLRAFADSEALKIKYTNKKTYLKNQPKGATAKSLYSIAEKIRYEKIGSNELKGVKNNITQCYENKFKNKKIEEIKTEGDVPITEAFELYLRSHFFKIKQNKKTEKILSYWKDSFDKNLKKKFNDLDNCIENQSKFNKIISELINNLDFEDSDSKDKEETKETKNDNSQTQNNEDEKNSTNKEEENQQSESELNIADDNINELNKNDDLNLNEEKEIESNTSLQNSNKKKKN